MLLPHALSDSGFQSLKCFQSLALKLRLLPPRFPRPLIESGAALEPVLRLSEMRQSFLRSLYFASVRLKPCKLRPRVQSSFQSCGDFVALTVDLTGGASERRESLRRFEPLFALVKGRFRPFNLRKASPGREKRLPERKPFIFLRGLGLQKRCFLRHFLDSGVEFEENLFRLGHAGSRLCPQLIRYTLEFLVPRPQRSVQLHNLSAGDLGHFVVDSYIEKLFENLNPLGGLHLEKLLELSLRQQHNLRKFIGAQAQELEQGLIHRRGPVGQELIGSRLIHPVQGDFAGGLGFFSLPVLPSVREAPAYFPAG